MHLNLPIPKSEKGCLYVVATPIGNMADITLRAVKTLGIVNIIAAEDTRHTSKLLAFHHIKTRMIAYHEHNERLLTPRLIVKMQQGESIALVSDAGTPLVSDPGYCLITAAVKADLKVVPIPGVSACIAAFSVSGLPRDSFLFIGFLSKKKAKRRLQLNQLSHARRTLIFYESPKRILSLVNEIILVIGDRKGVLAREMTKLHEEFVRGNLSEIASRLEQRSVIKGECTLMVDGGGDPNDTVSMTVVRQEIELSIGNTGKRFSQVVREIAEKYGLSKNRVYRDAIKQGIAKNRIDDNSCAVRDCKSKKI